MEILDGSKIAEKWLKDLKIELDLGVSEGLRKPRLEVILLGNDFGSNKYVEMKAAKAREIGIICNINRFSETLLEQDLIAKIMQLNEQEDVDGIMVQLPLPGNINRRNVLNAISPAKDVDGLTSENLGRAFHNDAEALLSATPLGVMKLLEEYKIELEGKDIIIIGKSDIVGLPLIAALLAKDATVQILNIKSKDKSAKCQNADILISAAGVAGLITAEDVKKGAVVIDIGISKDNSTGKIVGDVKFEEVKENAAYITPVPGGVGPMTIAALLSNVIKVWKNNGTR